ncbi:MAG: hypothetical protein FWC11_00765 [Firmicutes bacterium]|nr:hypothetical protein [Bacillota bacterium]
MIITALELWKDYKIDEFVFNETLLNEKEIDGILVKSFYFDGESYEGEDGRKEKIRIYAKLYEKSDKEREKKREEESAHLAALGLSSLWSKDAKNAIVVFDDAINSVEYFDFTPYLEKDISVFVVDYAGEAGTKERFTMYPNSFRDGLFEESASHLLHNDEEDDKDDEDEGETFVETKADLRLSRDFIWTTIAIRSCEFLKKLSYNQVGFLGVGEGGATVYRALIFDNVFTCGVTLFSHSDDMEDMEDDALSPASYAHHIKKPLFIQVSSNEQNNSLDYMSDIFRAAPKDKAWFSVSPRVARAISKNYKDNILKFFELCFKDEEETVVFFLKAKGSERVLYFEFSLDGEEWVEDSVKLYLAYSQENSSYRNWKKTTFERVGKNEFISKVKVYDENKPVFAFLSATMKNGLVVSSEIVRANPKSHNIKAENANQKRLIYDADEMGVAEWMVLYESEKGALVTTEEGPFGIQGVTSSINILSTFALADPYHIPHIGAILQIMLANMGENKEITFAITVKNEIDGEVVHEKYLSTKELARRNEWETITLEKKDFRKGEKVLAIDGNIITLEIWANDKFLVSSVKWI